MFDGSIMSLQGTVLVVGQEVGVLGCPKNTFGWHVTKVSPKSGQITIERKVKHTRDDGEVEIRTITRKFNKNGGELGKLGKWNRAYLETDVTWLKEDERVFNIKRDVATALKGLNNVHANVHWSKNELSTALNHAQVVIDAARETLNKL